MKLSRRKKLIFALIPAALLIALALAAEVGLRLWGGRFADDPYLNLAMSVSIFSEEVRDGGRYYRVSHPQAYGWRGVTFPIEKQPNTFRVFCLGGSACAGYPHPPEEDYADYLEFALQSAYPDREVEVFNVAAHGFASYRVRDVFDDVIEFDPDLVVIYSGNNEFLEKRSYLGTTRKFVQGSRLIRFLNVALGKWLRPENSLSAWGFSRDVELAMILNKIEEVALDLRKDPDQFRQVKEHYAYSIDYMLEKAHARGVPLAVLTVPANLRDWWPNVSYHELDTETEARWRAHYERGERAVLEGDDALAVAELRSARALSPEHARTIYLLARALDRQSQTGAAVAAYRAAKESDFNPFRALDILNQTLRDTAAQYSPTTLLIEAEAAFAAAADLPGAPGFELLLDYVHPNRRGNLLLAQQIYEAVLERQLLGAPPGDPTFRALDRDYDEDLDIDMSRELVMLYITQHQYRSVVARSSRALEVLAGGRERLPADATLTRDEYVEFFETARDVHTAYVAAERARLCGQPFALDYEQQLTRSYREFFFADLYREADARKSKKH